MMRTTSIALALLLAIAAPETRAALEPYVVPPSDHGRLTGAWVTVFYPERPAPKDARISLVRSGAEPGARAFRVLRRPYSEDDQSLSGQIVGRLEDGVAYDVRIAAPGAEPVVLPAAFTAHAPRFRPLTGTTAARGEVAYVAVDYADDAARFTVAGRRAPVVHHVRGDAWFGLRVPAALPRGITAADVTAATAGTVVTSADSIAIVDGRRELAASVDGRRRACSTQDWSEDAGRVLIQGQRAVSGPGRDAAEGFVLSLPGTFGGLTAGASFTDADGAWVETFNVSDRRMAFRGKEGVFHSTTCSITIDAIEGTRLRGTFSAHTIDRMTPGHDPDGREVEVTGGTFVVDPAPPRND